MNALVVFSFIGNKFLWVIWAVIDFKSLLSATVVVESVCHSVHREACMAGGMHGMGAYMGGHAWWGACGWGCAWWGHAWQAACMAGGHVRQGTCMAGGMHGGGVGVVGACMAEGMHGRGHAWPGACITEEMATAVDYTHPTGMHSCLSKEID